MYVGSGPPRQRQLPHRPCGRSAKRGHAELRVKGVPGLRVIDTSVMPHLVSGNTNAASVVIGDKGADLVLEPGPLQGGGM